MWHIRNPKGHKMQSSPDNSIEPTNYEDGPTHVTVLLSQYRIDAAPAARYEPFTEHITAIEFSVDAASRRAACEVAYAITNSYPTALHCESEYLDIVRTYREIGHFRSVSVDDVFVVDGERFVCARFGFRVSV